MLIPQAFVIYGFLMSFFLEQAIGATLVANGEWILNCKSISKLPAVTFILAGEEFTLKGVDYVLKVSDSTTFSHSMLK